MVQVSFKIGAYEDTVDCDVVPMTVCHLLLGRPWQFDKGAMHDGRTNYYSFKSNNKNFVLRPMTPSQVITDNAKSIARAQHDFNHPNDHRRHPTAQERAARQKGSSEKSGERETHHKVSESHKPNECDTSKRAPTKLTLFATKREMRELREDPSILHYVLI